MYKLVENISLLLFTNVSAQNCVSFLIVVKGWYDDVSYDE